MPRWLIPNGYLPGPQVEPRESHESLCLLNPTDEDAEVEVEVIVYFADREPQVGFRISAPARRSIHARLDLLRAATDVSIPLDTPYTLRPEIGCPIAIGVQHSRMDTRQANMTLFTTVGSAGTDSGNQPGDSAIGAWRDAKTIGAWRDAKNRNEEGA